MTHSKNKPTIFGKFILHYCIDNEIKQKDFAKILKITPTFLCMTILGHRPPQIKWLEILPEQFIKPLRKEYIRYKKEYYKDKLSEIDGLNSQWFS